MNKPDFAKLVASVKQAGKIRRREMKASRVFNLKPVVFERFEINSVYRKATSPQ
jgi:hypothetical protein